MPPGIMWKTLSVGGGMINPVWVEMTPALANAIFMTTLMHDSMFMAAKDTHRAAMLQAPDPYQYDFMSGWPESFIEICETQT